MNHNLTGICQTALIPVRKEPDETSEMITQILFGETFNIIGESGTWFQIHLHFDGYQGWVSKKMVSLLEHEIPQEQIIIKDIIARIILAGNNPEFIYIPGGSTLFPSEGGFRNNNISFSIDPVCSLHHLGTRIDIAGVAVKFLHSPYLWGGRSIFGIDCSGFTQIVFKMNDIGIPRDAYQQAEIGETIHFIEDAKIGDLLFFDSPEGRIIHTGLMIEKAKIIHASGKVRIDKIDHQGIFNEESNEYTHKLRLIKRIIP